MKIITKSFLLFLAAEIYLQQSHLLTALTVRLLIFPILWQILI